MSRRCLQTLSGEHWDPAPAGTCGACGAVLKPDEHRTGCGCPIHGPSRLDPMTFEDAETMQLRNENRDLRAVVLELLNKEADVVGYALAKERARTLVGP